MGLKPKEESLRLIVDRVKEMGDKGRTITDSDLYQIAVQIMGGGKRRDRTSSSSSRGSRS